MTDYLIDRTVLLGDAPMAQTTNYAGKGGTVDETFELVIDNSRLQANCLGATVIQVCPYDEGAGFIHNTPVIDDPTWVGSFPRLSDGDDTSWAVLTAQSHTDPDYLSSNPIAAYFRAPDDFQPTALAYKFRAKTSAGTPQHNYVLQTRISTADNSTEFLDERISGASGSSPDAFHDLMLTDGVVSLTTLESFWEGTVLNDSNPTDAGGWLEFVVDSVPGIIPALTGDGIRIDIGVWQEEDVDTSPHPVFELHQFCILVAGRYV